MPVELPNEIVHEVLRRMWPQSAAVAEKEGALEYLRHGVHTAMIHPDVDPELAEKAVATLRAIGDDYLAQGNTDGVEKIAATLQALANAHRAHADELEQIKRMRAEAEANGVEWPPSERTH